MEENQDIIDIKISDIFNCIKKGWKRIVIYVVVSALIFTSLFLLTSEIVGSKQYETTIKITTNNTTATNWNTTDKINQIIKSGTIVRGALTKAGYTTEEQDRLIAAGLISDITATALTTISNTSGQSFPETIKISVKEDARYGFSKEQYLAFIDTLIEVLKSEMTEKYTYKTNLASNLTMNDALNYLQHYSQFKLELNRAESFLESCKDATDGFVATTTKYSINDSIAEINRLEEQLNAIKLNITKNEILSNSTKVGINEKDYATQMELETQAQVLVLETQVTEYATLLQNYKPDIIVNGQASVDINNAYAQALSTYISLQNQLSAKKIEANEWKQIKEGYISAGNNSAEKNDEIRNSFNEFINSYNNIASRINKTIEEYNKDVLSEKYIKKIEPAKRSKEAIISNLTIVICEIAVVAIAFIAAILVTKRKLNNLQK